MSTAAAIGPDNAFAGVIGHARVMSLLADEIAAPTHAYYFVGPIGVGKATVARRFAAAILCQEGGRHVEDCPSCRRVLSGNHPDVALVEPEGRLALGVDEARTTVALANLAPMEGARKVILFEDAGAMTDAAANVLLKTLEEPSASTVFLLVSESEDDLPATIASRCRTVQFGRVGEGDLVDALLDAGVSLEQAADAAQISGGRPGLALALATEPKVASFRKAWLSVPGRVSPKPGEAFLLADELMAAADPLTEAIRQRHAEEESDNDTKAVKQRRDREMKRQSQALLITGLEILASWYTDAAVAQFGGRIRNQDLSSAELVRIRPAQAVAKADLVLEAVAAVRANQRPQLVLADLLTHLGVDA